MAVAQIEAISHTLDPARKPPVFSFTFSEFLRKEHRFGLDPNRPICKAFKEGHCPLGTACPDKHPPQPTFGSVVCKHWLRGLCKKGDNCDFLHEYNLRSMPECQTYARYQACPNNDECLYAHTAPEAKRPTCEYYDRGFCPLGPLCADRHVRRRDFCPFYMTGFCPDGKKCKVGEHPRWKEDARVPKVFVPKTEEEKEREREERERQAVEEMEKEREREERGLPPERGPGGQLRRGFRGRGRGGVRGQRGRGRGKQDF